MPRSYSLILRHSSFLSLQVAAESQTTRLCGRVLLKIAPMVSYLQSESEELFIGKKYQKQGTKDTLRKGLKSLAF